MPTAVIASVERESLLQEARRVAPGRKLVDSDVHGSRRLHWVAEQYLDLAGDESAWLRSVRDGYRRYGCLLDGQARGVLNWMRAQTLPAERQAARPAPSMAAPPVVGRALPDGYYTVVDGAGHLTVRLRRVEHPEGLRYPLPAGAQSAAYLFGPDNGSDYASFAWVTGGEARVWGRYRGGRAEEALRVLLGAGADQRGEASLAYALASGRCARCGRLLTVPASIHRGFGPDCAGKLAGE